VTGSRRVARRKILHVGNIVPGDEAGVMHGSHGGRAYLSRWAGIDVPADTFNREYLSTGSIFPRGRVSFPAVSFFPLHAKAGLLRR
jgi:hypothetical protein